MIDPAEARKLLDAGENTRLLALVTPEEMSVAWCGYASRGGIDWEDDPDGWAAELMFESEFLENDDFVYRFLVSIAESAPDELLSWVGAGPVAECLADPPDDRPDRRAWAEAQASQSERFRIALSQLAPFSIGIERRGGSRQTGT